ncbi:MAG: ExeA family protein [Sulfuricaulis sp.]
MYLQYFGLHENPFSIPPDPHYLYLSRGHQEALAHLQYGLGESGGFVQLTGEVGTGKTLLIRALVERLPENVDVALILYPVLTVSEFIAAICDELRVPHPGEQASLKQLIDALNAHLLQNHAKGRHTVLVIDEAQNLNREVLEQIRLLTNLETTKQKLLQIILTGQPELAGLLAQQDLRQLAQRITARFHLAALTRKETFDYILHRCRVAGARTLLFDRAGIERVFAKSGGVPRLINVICDRALLGAYVREKSVVDMRIVDRAAAEIGSSTKRRRWLTQRVAVPVLALLAVAIVVAVWQWRAGRFPWLTSHEPSAAVISSAATPPATGATETAQFQAIAAEKVAFNKPALVAIPPKPAATLESMLEDPGVSTDTDSAMQDLFERWGLDYAKLPGTSACERALNAGLHCLYQTGTWNNLRSHNRPAVIELKDSAERRHHVLVASLTSHSVILEMGKHQREFPIGEVDRLWFGKYLLLWKPSAPQREILRVGDRGEGVIWLRDALARYRGESLSADSSEVFDDALATELRQFQHRRWLAADGVAGPVTRTQLQGYLPDRSPTLATDTAATETH